MGDELTCYVEFEFTGTGTPTAKQWQDLMQVMPDQPFARALALAASATGDHPDRQLSFTSLSPDGKRMLGQVTIVPDATRSAVRDAAIKEALRNLYRDAGGVIPADPDDLTIKDALLVVLDSEAAKKSISGTRQAKLAGVLQQEARDAARTGLGYSDTQAGRLAMRVVAMGDQVTASAAARAYARANWTAQRG